MFCRHCGNKLADYAKFCPKCGNPVQTQNYNNQMTNNQTLAGQANSQCDDKMKTEEIGSLADKIIEMTEATNPEVINKDSNGLKFYDTPVNNMETLQIPKEEIKEELNKNMEASQPLNQPASQSVNQPVKKAEKNAYDPFAGDNSNDDLISNSTNQGNSMPVQQPMQQQMQQPVQQPMQQPVQQPVQQQMQQPVQQQMQQPVKEPKASANKSEKNNVIIFSMAMVILCLIVVVAVLVFGKVFNSDNKEANNVTTEASNNETKKQDKRAEETTEAESQTEETTKSEDYVLVDSDKRLISKEELQGLTQEELRIARNELYARHGRKFNDEGLQSYFNSKEWYQPTIEANDFTDTMLNEIELANKDTIVSYEEEMNYR